MCVCVGSPGNKHSSSDVLGYCFDDVGKSARVCVTRGCVGERALLFKRAHPCFRGEIVDFGGKSGNLLNFGVLN